MPRDCKFVARVKADQSEFAALFEAADKCANGSDRWAGIQPGYMAFHFEAQDAHLKFCVYVAGRNLQLIASDDQHDNDLGKPAVEVKKATSEKLRTCRELVHDDAFEAQIALHMATPLLKNALKELKLDYLYNSGLFLAGR